VIETLRERRYLDDGRFAEAFVTAHADRGQGPHRIREELKALVPSDVAQAALAAGPDWGALARRVRAAKFGPEAPPDWKTKARQARFLQYRGFSADHIRRAFGGDFDESVLESAD
jgi:regulatory protein